MMLEVGTLLSALDIKEGETITIERNYRCLLTKIYILEYIKRVIL